MKKVVLIGDSIRLHYQPYVERALAGSAEVWGPAENCEMSSKIRDRLHEWVVDREPDVVHLNCGLHDLRYNPGSTSRQATHEEYAQNLEYILTTLAAETRSRVIWATITPINEVRHRSHRFRRYEADVAAYNTIANGVVNRFGVVVNDLYGTVNTAGADSLLKQDGVHFTDEGCAFLARHVVAAVQSALANSDK